MTNTQVFQPRFANLVERFFLPLETQVSTVKHTFPLVNIKENETDFTLEIAAPGLQKEDFKIAVKENKLTISTQKVPTETSTKILRQEFNFATFERTFQLPKVVDSTKIVAQYENGILVVGLPKKAEEAVQIVEISVA